MPEWAIFPLPTMTKFNEKSFKLLSGKSIKLSSDLGQYRQRK